MDGLPCRARQRAQPRRAIRVCKPGQAAYHTRICHENYLHAKIQLDHHRCASTGFNRHCQVQIACFARNHRQQTSNMAANFRLCNTSSYYRPHISPVSSAVRRGIVACAAAAPTSEASASPAALREYAFEVHGRVGSLFHSWRVAFNATQAAARGTCRQMCTQRPACSQLCSDMQQQPYLCGSIWHMPEEACYA